MSAVRAFLASTAIASLAVLSGCGDEAREFTAAELIFELHQKGAPIHLQGELFSNREGIQTYELALDEASGPAARGGGHDHAGSAATLILTEEEEDAPAEFERCQAAVTLTCFRVANGVLVLGGSEPPTLAKIEAAVRAMESE